MSNWIQKSVAGAMLAGSLAATQPVQAAVDMFIKISDIKGESADDKHKGEIDVLSWSWGVTQSGARAAGAAAGKATVNTLTITKYIDASSPLLFQTAIQGKRIAEATFVVRKAGGKQLEYIKIKLKDVVVMSVKPGGSGGQDRFTEEVSLNFSGAEYSYITQKPDGSAGPAITTNWSGGV
jgi:type VI secretion system secreted protein Hcp